MASAWQTYSVSNEIQRYWDMKSLNIHFRLVIDLAGIFWEQEI